MKNPPDHTVPASEIIPIREKIGFSLGANVDLVCSTLLTALFMPIFNIGLGMAPLTIGLILMLLRAWDAVADLVMGYVTDNIRTRWGRRRPYMVIGAIGCALVYPVFWFLPPEFSDNGKFIYLMAVGMVFYVFYACWAMPYYGLQLELTPNYHERTRLTAWMTIFYNIAALFTGWNLAFLASDLFADAGTGKPNLVTGMKSMCWVYAFAILLFGLAPAFFVKERVYARTTEDVAGTPAKRESFWQSLRESFSNKPLWILIGVTFLLVIGSTVMNVLFDYVLIYYVCHGDLAEAGVVGGWKMTVSTVAGLALIPFWTWLGRLYDKRTLVIVTLLVIVGGHMLGYFLITPVHPYLSLIAGSFAIAGNCAVWLFLPSMKGDVSDFDEQSTGRRREGSINSFYSWFFKVALTLSSGISGWVLEATGFDVKVNASDPAIHWRVFLFYLVLPLIFWIGALILIWLYPLTQAKMAAIRTELEARRGTVRIAG